jgi:hypothetical protein
MSDEVGNYPLTIQQGGTVARTFTWTDDADPPAGIDLTGCHVAARIYLKGVAGPALIISDEEEGGITIADQDDEDTRGQFAIIITDEQTDELFQATGSWRLDVLHPSGTVTPLLGGTVKVIPRSGVSA